MFCNWIFQWAKKSNLGSFTSQKKTKKYLLTNLVENILITVLLTIKIRFKSPYKKIKVWPLKDISRTVTNFKKLIEQNMFEITRNLLFFFYYLQARKSGWPFKFLAKRGQHSFILSSFTEDFLFIFKKQKVYFTVITYSLYLLEYITCYANSPNLWYLNKWEILKKAI